MPASPVPWRTTSTSISSLSLPLRVVTIQSPPATNRSTGRPAAGTGPAPGKTSKVSASVGPYGTSSSAVIFARAAALREMNCST